MYKVSGKSTTHKVNYDVISKSYDDIREADVVLINYFLEEIPGDQVVLENQKGFGKFQSPFQNSLKAMPAQPRIPFS